MVCTVCIIEEREGIKYTEGTCYVFSWVSVIMGLQVPTTGKKGVGKEAENFLWEEWSSG